MEQSSATSYSFSAASCDATADQYFLNQTTIHED
jgi:hypothetical protein